MRRAIALPSMGMVGAFFLGLGIMLLWGMSAAETGSNIAAQFFGSLATFFTSSVIGWVLLVMLFFVILKLWYIMVPFFLGVVVGLLILTFFQSSLATGLGILFFKSLGNRVHASQNNDRGDVWLSFGQGASP